VELRTIIQARELGAFTAVGTAATVVQIGVVGMGVPCGLPPLAANALGFLAAFVVGFAGHARWSFPLEGKRVWPALWRFALLSLLGFGLNEVCYAGALRFTTLDYRVALLVVLVLLAGVQLLASKHWAFALDRKDAVRVPLGLR
jgi:putative flippase GtrA